MQCRAYAKALHYTEVEFQKSQSTQVIESLISINNKLHQKETASALLDYAKKHHTEETEGKHNFDHYHCVYIVICAILWTL